jgi:hypothetical protein
MVRVHACTHARTHIDVIVNPLVCVCAGPHKVGAMISTYDNEVLATGKARFLSHRSEKKGPGA